MSDGTGDQQTCARALVMGTHYADRRDLDGMLSFFTDDVVLERMGARIEGKAAIRRFLEGRLAETSSNRVTRHVVGFPIITLTGSDEAEGFAAFALFEGERSESAGPLPLELPVVVGDFTQRYRREGGVWKICFTRNDAIFRRT